MVLAYDADSAGEKAALRGILRKGDCGQKYCIYPMGKIRTSLLEKTVRRHFWHWWTGLFLMRNTGLPPPEANTILTTSEGSIGFLKEARDMLSGMSPVEADIYIKKIVQKTPGFPKVLFAGSQRSAGERPAETAGTGAPRLPERKRACQRYGRG